MHQARRSWPPAFAAAMLAVVALAAGPTAPASAGTVTNEIANCSVNLRASASTTATTITTISTGTGITSSGTVTGDAWSGTCVTTVSGNTWYVVSAVNGESVQSLYGVSAVYAATGMFRSASYLEGIDVSFWQGTIDFTKVKAAGESFVIAKATEGIGYLDSTYAANKTNARAAGLTFTGYHYARPDLNPTNPVGEADWFVSQLGLVSGMLPPALDLEVAGALGTTGLQNWVAAWLGEVYAKTGVRAMIYTSPSFWQTYMGDTELFADQGYSVLWIAHWFVSAPRIPANNWGGHSWTFWQYDDCGSVPGISGCVDLDRFNGTDMSSVLVNLQAPSANFTAPATGTTATTSSASNAISWTEATGGGQITSRTLSEYYGKVVTPGTCSGVSWTKAWSASFASNPSPYTLGGFNLGYCYYWTVNLTNSNALSGSGTSGFLLIAPPSATFTTPASGTTVPTSSTSYTVAWTETSPNSTVTSRTLTEYYGKVVTPGTCSGVSWVKAWSASFASPRTISGFNAGYCYYWTVSLTNASGFTGGGTSGYLLEASPSATFTAPANATTVVSTNWSNATSWTEYSPGATVSSRTLAEYYGKVVTRGSCIGVSWTKAWAISLASNPSPFTITGFEAGYCYYWTVAFTNSAGVSGSGTSGYLLIQAPSATFTAPAAGTTVTATSTSYTVSWTESSPGTTITSRTLTEYYGKVVTAGSCSGVSWLKAWSASFTSPRTISGFNAGYCYYWTVTLTNSGGLSGGGTSGYLLIPVATATFTAPAAGATVSTTSTTNAISWTESSIWTITSRSLSEYYGKVVTAGSCSGVSWTKAWSTSFSSNPSPFTLSGFNSGYCYYWAVSLTNSSGVSGGGTSGNLLIQ